MPLYAWEVEEELQNFWQLTALHMLLVLKLLAMGAPHAGPPDAQRQPPGHASGRRRADLPVRRRPLGTRLSER